MNRSLPDILAHIEDRTGYRFTNNSLLEEALTHSSFLNESPDKGLSDNERLEFFGDSVLSLFISHRLLLEFPDKREGELSRMRATLVDETALARSAALLGIGELLRLGRGEERSGGRSKKSVLADAYEALIGAMYLDGGADAVIPLIERQYASLSTGGDSLFAGRDSKSSFQEAAQSLMGMVPTYTTVGAGGPDHARTFTVAVYLGDELMGNGSGRSKKEGEQEAARRGLELLISRTGSGKP